MEGTQHLISDAAKRIAAEYFPKREKIKAIKVLRELFGAFLNLSHCKAILDEEWQSLANRDEEYDRWRAEGISQGWIE